MANPGLGETERAELVGRLMEARRPVRGARKAADPEAEAMAHRAVDQVKQALGGPVWRGDGSPDLNRHMAKNTLYAEWYANSSLRPGRNVNCQKRLCSHAFGLDGPPRVGLAGSHARVWRRCKFRTGEGPDRKGRRQAHSRLFVP
jgi:hypothetical protein